MTKIKKFMIEHRLTISEVARANSCSRANLSLKINKHTERLTFNEILTISKLSKVQLNDFEEILKKETKEDIEDG